MIVFVEATSSLDGETDAAVMAVLSGTLMLIAHHLTNLAGTDVVHVLDEAWLIVSGPPDTVLPLTPWNQPPSIV
ncbi:hypothetical protein MBUL_01340 [Methylobacterium bullatum]|uniref:Uncharacterized protein n=1 Tax=Methylobacterium bullatum TaxID=570505 RepID=A0A679ISJ1_9HYPH|nr:hypothetical protein MBUL_01340 [Methylobacterium bullatum]